MGEISEYYKIPVANIAEVSGLLKANIGEIIGITMPSVLGPFRFEVVTAEADNFQLPIYDGGNYDFHVDWGDESSDDIIAWNDAAANHAYAGADTYNVVITGTLVGWRFNKDGDKDLIHDISEWGVLDVGNLEAYFYGCSNLTISATGSMNCPDTTTFKNGFNGCTSLTSIPSGLFDNCTLVTSFFFCFAVCSGINTDLPVNLILHNVEIDDCAHMFNDCSNMTGDGTAFVDQAETHGVTTHNNCFT
ncbi:unnamed protein product, partial [marine sediment metagenome]